MNTTWAVDFRHGLGDSAYFAAQIPLYRSRGFDLTVHCNPDKAFLFHAAGAKTASEILPDRKVHWEHAPGINGAAYVHPATVNKAAHNLGIPPLPAIGRPEQLWGDFVRSKVSVLPWIPPQDWKRVREFLEPLARPVILLHTIGNTFGESKSLPADLTLALYERLLDATEGTLVLLDWDNRAPRLPSHRVRHLTDDWLRAEVPALAALLALSDLLIGIDSGPFHFARMTGTPALGVFLHEKHHPVKYALPREDQAFVVPARCLPAINRSWRSTYNFLEEDQPSALSIAEHAKRMLQGTRYLPPSCPGADLLLQHWIRNRLRGGGSALTPRVDRDRTFDRLLRECRARFHRPHIVETGCIRAAEDWRGAGYSTLIFAVYVHHSGGRLTSIDIREDHCQFAREQTRMLDGVSIVTGDSVTELTKLSSPVDVLYLDSVDTNHPQASDHALREAEAALPFLHRQSLVMIDDTVYSAGRFRGNGAKAVPWLLEHGWRVLESGYQTLLGQR